jgi:hypothetical protein
MVQVETDGMNEFQRGGCRGCCRDRFWVLLTLVACLQGCTATLEYFEPTPVGFEPLTGSPFYLDDCIRAPDQIAVPLGGGASMGVRGYSGTPRTTLSGQVYVPAGSEVRFVSAVFKVRDGAGREQSGVISEITRRIPYGPTKRTAGSSSETQKLSSGDPLIGWSVADVRSSGLVPPASFFLADSDTQNFFDFFVPFEQFVAPEFSVRIPDIVVNGRSVPGKSIAFRRVKKKVYGNPLCS